MANMSDYLESALGDHLLRASTFSKPSTIYVALFTASPGDGNTGTEVSGGSYARVQVSQLNNQWNVSNGVYTNNNDITFPTATANWGTITSFGLFDASSGGNLIVWGVLQAEKIINSGDATAKFSAGTLQITFK